MPTEPVTCVSCSRKFSPRFAKCPFCNAARAEASGEARDKCAECGRERNPGLSACPYCHPDLVKAVGASRPPRPVVLPSVELASSSGGLELTRRHALISAGVAAFGLLATLLCLWRYDRIGPDSVGLVARVLAGVTLVFVGAWLRASFRSSRLDFARLRGVLLGGVMVVVPAHLVLYAALSLINAWTASDPVDVACLLDTPMDGKVAVTCRPPDGGSLRGRAQTAQLARVSSRWFTARARSGGLGTWLIDYDSAVSGEGAQPRLRPGEATPLDPLEGPGRHGPYRGDEPAVPRMILPTPTRAP